MAVHQVVWVIAICQADFSILAFSPYSTPSKIWKFQYKISMFSYLLCMCWYLLVDLISTMNYGASPPGMCTQCDTSSWLGWSALQSLPVHVLFLHLHFKKFSVPYGNGIHICNFSHIFPQSLAFPYISTSLSMVKKNNFNFSEHPTKSCSFKRWFSW